MTTNNYDSINKELNNYKFTVEFTVRIHNVVPCGDVDTGLTIINTDVMAKLPSGQPVVVSHCPVTVSSTDLNPEMIAKVVEFDFVESLIDI